MNDEIAARIRFVIDHYGLTVSTFADVIGVQRSSVSHLMNGRNKPSLDFILKTVKAYPEINLYWLLNGKGSFPSKDKLQENANNLKNIEASVEEIAEEKEIGKIVIFYTDGSFESFRPKKT